MSEIEKYYNGEIHVDFEEDYEEEFYPPMRERDKDKEIERLQKEIKEYQEELEKADSITQSCIFEGKEEATMSFRECLNHLERLHSIIKEAKEFIYENAYDTERENCIDDLWGEIPKLLEILDKEKE